jgi:cysteine desulfurase
MKVYLDNSSTTAVDKEVVSAMQPYFSQIYGNPSTMHNFGSLAHAALSSARQTVADIISAESDEIIFTGCGTESDCLTLFGIVSAYEKKAHIITTKIEHHAVLNTALAIQKMGHDVTFLNVDKEGRVNIDDVKNAIRENTILISIMQANNEVGTLEPIEEIGMLLREINKTRAQKIYYHTDAVQSISKIDINVKKLGIDLLSASAHKFNGPKGCGFLYIKKGTNINPIMFGGHQESGLRPGTENVPSIVGLASALSIATADEASRKTIHALRKKLQDGISAKIPQVFFNGSQKYTVGNILNVSFNCIEGEALLARLDAKGIAASTGSACATGSPSHVLEALGVDPILAQGSVRFSFGRYNTQEEIDYVLEVLPPVVEGLRNMSPLWKGGNTNNAKD